MLAILNYEDDKGHLPPAYTVDADGSRLHSWRTLILPYIEGNIIYDRIDLTKPWNDPANEEARNTIMYEYSCPSTDLETGMTTYLAVVGPNCGLTGSDPREMPESATDRSNTIIVLEVPTERAVHWMSPEDISPDELIALLPDAEMSHNGTFLAAYLDGHAEGIDSDIDREVLRSMLTIDGGEAAEE